MKERKNSLMKRFFSYYRPYKKLFIIDTICCVLISLLRLAFPMVAGDIIDIYIPGKNLQMLLVSCGLLLVVYILRAGLSYVIDFWGHILGVRIQGDMRRDLFNHLQTLPFPYFDENKTGSIMSRIVNDLLEIAELAHHGPEDVLTSVLTLTGAIVILSFANVYLTLIIFVLMILMFIFVLWRRKKMRQASKESREKIAVVNAGLESSISGIRVTKAFTAEDVESRKFENYNKVYKNARFNFYKNMGIFHSGMGFFHGLIYLAALTGGGLFFYFNLIKMGEFVTFLLCVNIVLEPISLLMHTYQQIQDGVTGFKRFTEIMDIPSEIEPENPRNSETFSGDIVFENITFSYNKDDAEEGSMCDGSDGNSKTIKGLNMEVKSGSTIAIVGPSGGGKTTLCHLLPRFYELNDGRITIGGVDITTLRRSDLRKNIGIVQQDVFLFAGSIKENIAYGKPDATMEEIITAAKRADIHEFANNLPNGYNTEIGERGVKLSGGQKQRISIARAFIKNPKILILDEATSALDNFAETQIQSALDELSKGRTTIVVAHRLSTIKNSDKIYVLTQNGIEESGTHKELLQNNGIYAGLYSFYN